MIRRSEDGAPNDWLDEVPIAISKEQDISDGTYAALIRQLDDANGHIVYAGDLRIATTLMGMSGDKAWANVQARWILRDCRPISPRDALAIVCTALRRDPEKTERLFRSVELVSGITVRLNGVSVK